MYDLANKTSVQLTYAAKVTTNSPTEANGTAIDLQGYESATLVANVGAEGDTLSGSVFFEIALQHSDASGSGFTDVTQSEITNGTIAANGVWLKLDGTTGGDPDTTGLVAQVGYIGGKRYIRGQINVTGTHSNGTPISLTVIKGDARHTGNNTITAHNV